MNRLWVRLSFMISGVLFLVFFTQFLSIMLQGPPDFSEQPGQKLDGASSQEITGRLFEWMAFSVLVGSLGGVVIGRVVSAPISNLAKAAHQVGKGDLSVRAPVRGSQELVELAETFNRMAADLQHAETLRSNLMADVSHELRTPLTVLEGNLRAALDHVYTLDEAEIANLYTQTRHLIRLVNDLRELALAEVNQLPVAVQPTNVNLLLSETLQALDPLAAEKGVRLLDELPALPQMDVDPSRLRQVFFNLLSNSLRHTPAGGTITIQGQTRQDGIVLRMIDTGEGLEPEQLNAVFDRFYRGDKSRSRDTGGTGLGLAIVKAIIQAHGGSIEAQSAGKGLGSTFLLILPFGKREP